MFYTLVHTFIEIAADVSVSLENTIIRAKILLIEVTIQFSSWNLHVLKLDPKKDQNVGHKLYNETSSKPEVNISLKGFNYPNSYLIIKFNKTQLA